MDEIISLDYGSGGKKTARLIEKLILPRLDNPALRELGDGAIVDGGEKLVFSTDSFVVSPLFFPGGDIGKISVAGTVNDISVMGATPIALGCSVIMEEGLDIDVVDKVMDSMGRTAEGCGVPIATGDTKVVEAGAVDQMVMSTSAIGKRSQYLDSNLAKAAEYRKVDNRWCTDSNVRPGDAIIVSGYVGDHGVALLSFREGYGFESEVQSDVAPLNKMIAEGLKVGGIVAMKDPTRGGLANTLNEWCSKSHIGMEIEYSSIPLRDGVVNACDLLGIDPLSIGNEGKAVMGVVPEMAEEVVKALRRTPEGKDAAIIGYATEGVERVILRTEVGGRRILEAPAGDPVPRIC